MELAKTIARDYRMKNIPPDVLRLIGSLLDPKSVLEVCRTDKYINASLCKDSTIWKFFWERDLSKHVLPKDGQWRQGCVAALRAFEGEDAEIAAEWAAEHGYEIAAVALLREDLSYVGSGYVQQPYYLTMQKAVEHGHTHVVDAIVGALGEKEIEPILTGLLSNVVTSPLSLKEKKKAIKHFISLGQDVNELSSLPLRTAVRMRDKDLVKFLLGKGATDDRSDNVVWAAVWDEQPLLALLVAGRLPPVDPDYRHVLRKAASKLSPEDAAELDRLATDPEDRRILGLRKN